MTDFSPEEYVPTPSIVDSSLATIEGHAVAFDRKEPRPCRNPYRGKALWSPGLLLHRVHYPCGRPEVWVHGSTAMGVSGGKARSSTWYWWPNPLVAERGERCSALRFIPHRAMARGRSDD
jgi:hypothetical protein